jgi:carbon-monoxide dehydrogenase small subunit
MTRIALIVNGKPVEADVPPRTHSADLLREQLLLTGTHIGCEHGICGACTVEIDGEIARSCITYAVACDGARVRTIEGFDDDALMARLRQAFSEAHALQCGYCTPGMLIAARDLVRRKGRLPRAEIRTEMSGNLCRCTGYMGLVDAIERVMAEPAAPAYAVIPAEPAPAPEPGGDDPRHVMAGPGAWSHDRPSMCRRLSWFIGRQATRERHPHPRPSTDRRPHPSASPSGSSRTRAAPPGSPRASSSLTPAMQSGDSCRTWRRWPAACPASRSTARRKGTTLAGRLEAKIGPISASFAGEGTIRQMPADYRRLIEGRGGDRKSGSRASGSVDYRLSALAGEAGRDATRVDVTISYALTGALAQIGRSGLVRDLVRRIGEAFAQNLDAQLRDPAAAMPELGSAASRCSCT